jgi:hypothetical protein
VLVLVVCVVVDAQHDRDVGIRRGRRDHDLLRAGVEMLLRVLPLREEARRLEHDLNVEILPSER